MDIVAKHKDFTVYKTNAGKLVFFFEGLGIVYSSYEEFMNSYEEKSLKDEMRAILKPHTTDYKSIEGFKSFNLKIPTSVHARLKDRQVNMTAYILDAIIEKLQRENN